MKRLTTDNPKNNLQTALNLFYAKDGEAWVRGGGPEYEYQDVPLFTYIRSVIQHQALSQHLWEEMDTAIRKIRSVNVMGLTPFSGLSTVSVPSIPYLAQGAVLPANKPFMAVVGDQRHGTNVEAPLTTIQEAVANVMGDQVAAMMAGFNALLEENQLLRQVVENIELGDSTIGQAAERYQLSAAITRGV